MITYVIGDATQPMLLPAIICHVCNDVGSWGRGFVLAISKKWKEPEAEFRGIETAFLGDVQFVPVEPGILVANMIAQHGLRGMGDNPPIRYDAVRTALCKVAIRAMGKYTVHMPRIGCGLAGGKWREVEAIIKETMPDIQVYVYDLLKKEELNAPVV